MTKKISFIIPFIHEFPALPHTIFSIQAEMQDSPYSWDIIAVENGTVDEHTPRWFTGPKAVFRDEIGKKIKYMFDPIQCGPHARNTGARASDADFIMFMDAHTGLGKNSVTPLVEFLEDTPNAGLISGLTSWSTYWYDRMGSYYELFLLPAQQATHSGGRTLDVAMHGHYMAAGHIGTKHPEEYKKKLPVKVVMGSQAFTMYRRNEFLEIGGYCDAARFYPHPEGYMPLKMWMWGKEAYVHPNSYHFHSMFPRKYELNPAEGSGKRQEYGGYSWAEHGRMNVYKIAYILGEEKWANICKKSMAEEGGNRPGEDERFSLALEQAKPIRKGLSAKFIYSLDDILTMARRERILGMENWFDPIGPDPLRG